MNCCYAEIKTGFKEEETPEQVHSLRDFWMYRRQSLPLLMHCHTCIGLCGPPIAFPTLPLLLLRVLTLSPLPTSLVHWTLPSRVGTTNVHCMLHSPSAPTHPTLPHGVDFHAAVSGEQVIQCLPCQVGASADV